jgi:DNA-binding XRE family transcriptional regulator
VTSFSKWDRDAYRARVGEEEAARRRGAIMAEQWGHQLAEQRKRLGFTQAGLAEIMGVTPGRVSQIEHGEVSTVEALASRSRPSAASWNSSRTSAGTCSRCRPTRPPDAFTWRSWSVSCS